MKAKLIRDLDSEELHAFHSSALFKVINSEFSYVSSYLAYNRQYFGEEYQDFSVVVFEKSDFLIAFFAFSKSSTISFFNNPVKVFDVTTASKVKSFAYQNLFIKLEELRVSYSMTQFFFYENPYLLSKYFDSIESKEIDSLSYIDLSQTADEIKMNVRKSYKSLINWGNVNLSLTIIDAQNQDREKFLSFKEFHIKTSGRQTRSDLTWDLQYEGILKGQAYLLLGYFKEHLVSGAYIIHGTEQAYYGVAVQDRDLMKENLPLGHAILIASISKAKEIGLKTFIVGDVNASSDEKLNAIAKYKKGFSNTLSMSIKCVAAI